MESKKKLSNEEILSNIYYDLEKGYGSVRSLYELAKEEGATTTLEEVRHFMKKQPNKQIKGYNNYNSYLVPYARAEFQIDIMDMKMFMQEGEERYALVVIDAFSKLTNVVPMKNKDGKNVLDALKQSFKIMGEPVEIYSDDDGAFQSVVKEYLDSLGIIHKTTRTHANIVERMIRTIKKGVGDRVRFTKGKWSDMIKPTLKKYNETIHSSTGAKPVEAHKDENRVKVKVNLTLKQKHFRRYPQLQVGDLVKIYTKGAGNYTSRKETVSRWSDKKYKIEKIDRDMTLQKYYVLEGLKRRYLRHELLLINEP